MTETDYDRCAMIIDLGHSIAAFARRAEVRRLAWAVYREINTDTGAAACTALARLAALANGEPR